MAAAVPPRRLRPAPDDSHDLRAWAIDFRFVREVERLEREGRVPSRGALELALGLHPGSVALMRRGRRSVLPLHIAELQRHYNADYKYILFGERLDGEGDPIRWLPGRGRQDLRQYPELVYAYRQPAGWAIGPQPEADARHYPPDPTGAVWIPHAQAPAAVRGRFHAYARQHPDLNLLALDAALSAPSGRLAPATTPASQPLADELRDYLAGPNNPARPAGLTRYQAHQRALKQLAPFLYPATHPKAGQPSQQFARWWRTPGSGLTPEQAQAMRAYLGLDEKSPAG